MQPCASISKLFLVVPIVALLVASGNKSHAAIPLIDSRSEILRSSGSSPLGVSFCEDRLLLWAALDADPTVLLVFDSDGGVTNMSGPMRLRSLRDTDGCFASVLFDGEAFHDRLDFRDPTTRFRPPGRLTGTPTAVLGVNELGAIAGTSGNQAAIALPGGSVSEFLEPPDGPASNNAAALDIDTSGRWACGRSSDALGALRATVWELAGDGSTVDARFISAAPVGECKQIIGASIFDGDAVGIATLFGLDSIYLNAARTLISWPPYLIKAHREVFVMRDAANNCFATDRPFDRGSLVDLGVRCTDSLQLGDRLFLAGIGSSYEVSFELWGGELGALQRVLLDSALDCYGNFPLRKPGERCLREAFKNFEAQAEGSNSEADGTLEGKRVRAFKKRALRCYRSDAKRQTSVADRQQCGRAAFRQVF